MMPETKFAVREDAKHLAQGLKNAQHRHHIRDYIERRFRPLLSRQKKDRVREIMKIVSLAVGRQPCTKFVYARP